jgi:site-specific recombinase XerD
LEKDEIDALLDAPDSSTRIGTRDHALLLFMYNSGARASEAAHLSVGDLRLHSPTEPAQSFVELHGKGNKVRLCPLWTSTARELKQLTDKGKVLVLINRDKYWQCAFVIPKGEAENIKKRGLEAFRQEIAGLELFLSDRVSELGDWSKVSLLTVAVDRLQEWALPGLLCIGDAAHAMS